MSARTHLFDLATLGLTAGEARRLSLEVPVESFSFGGQRYEPAPPRVEVTLDVSRMTGGGYALRLRLQAALEGPCMRCLDPASPTIVVDSREVDQPGGGDELTSPYVEGAVLDVAAWTHDALALALPSQIVCRDDCRGLCPVCGERLEDAGPEHRHEPAPDPRWAKLRELKLD
jgi:uncharacterized protein